MDKPTDVIRDEPLPPETQKRAPLSWGFFLVQFCLLVIVYFVSSALPAIPSIIEAAQTRVAPVMSSGAAAGSVMFSMACALFVAWLFLHREKRVAEVWNLSAPASWKNTLLLAIAGAIGTMAIFSIGAFLLEAIGLPAPDASLVLNYVTESPLSFFIWAIGVGVLAAGLGEELLWRGFLMDRLNRLAGLRGKWALILIIQAALFGLPHAYQGVGGMILTASVGLLFGVMRIMQKGNLWAVFIAHASYDVVAMSLAYADNAGWLGS